MSKIDSKFNILMIYKPKTDYDLNSGHFLFSDELTVIFHVTMCKLNISAILLVIIIVAFSGLHSNQRYKNFLCSGI